MHHTTHSVVMVPPNDFAFNEQTGEDNEFQKKSLLNSIELREEALSEFNEMINLLRDQHIEVLVLNKAHFDPEIPDAVFPNNWFSTSPDGKMIIYPMKALNRQAEVRPELLKKLLESNQYEIKNIEVLHGNKKSLEGTGAIIFDHQNKIAYASISERCDLELFNQFCKNNDLKAVSFSTQSSNGKAFYHTNVMMSIGENFVVICSQAINNVQQRQTVLTLLEQSNKEVIDITLKQAEESFCANILQLKNTRGEFCIVISESASKGFTTSQIARLKTHGKLIICPISTIENVGGGSARCMLAENFLPKI